MIEEKNLIEEKLQTFILYLLYDLRNRNIIRLPMDIMYNRLFRIHFILIDFIVIDKFVCKILFQHKNWKNK